MIWFFCRNLSLKTDFGDQKMPSRAGKVKERKQYAKK